jgi:DNA-binding NtrC family response regulator
MTAYGSVKTAVDAMREGASDFLLKPFEFEQLRVRLERLREGRDLLREVAVLRKALGSAIAYCGLVGTSPQMRRVFELIEQFADNPANVLVVGETGTGKELVARALHARGGRASGPFVAVGCTAVPRDLAESELFGHEAGSFTGALKLHRGRIEQARRGSLFLDDVDDLPIDLQSKLLRVLEERTFQRVGGEELQRADIRLISATKYDLETLTRQNKFRLDLMYRLKVLVIELAPLRERREDILPLVRHFLETTARERGTEPKTISTSAAERLVSHLWPGNVRELRHAIEYAMAVSRGPAIEAQDLPPEIRSTQKFSPYILNLDSQETLNLRDLTEEFERDLITWALRKAHGNQLKAAAILGIPRTTLQSKL